jgi:hypothetical protein
MRQRPTRPITTPATRQPRAEVHDRVECRIVLGGAGGEVHGTVRNLNTSGMSVWTDDAVAPESECEVCLQFGGDPADVQVQGWVVYANQNALAIQFDELEPDAAEAIKAVMARALETA